MAREAWKTKIGLILAMAGNAVGLGNFLRFPVQAVQNGGGAFMIPYFVAFLLLGIPLMWIEWGMGRFGGKHGYGTVPRIFDRLWNHPAAKYVGVLGLFIPLALLCYYMYICSWTLGYSVFSVIGQYDGILTRESMGSFLAGYQGVEVNQYFHHLWPAFFFFMVTLVLTTYTLSHGLVSGIERLAKVAMPALFIFGVILVVRIFMIGAPDPAVPEQNIVNGLAFIWNPNFSELKNSSVWLAAAGQVFFTLSLGFGAIQTYASYVPKNDDVALTGLTTAMTNEFAEVILGSSIAIPVAVAFFGLTETMSIAHGGAFDLGFQSMPIIFQRIPWGSFFGCMWFLLLFFAGITSCVAMAQPIMALLKEEFGLSTQKAAYSIGAFLLIATLPVMFFIQYGFLDELDFWIGTFGLVVFAVIEVVLFVWVFGSYRCWKEITRGSYVQIPQFFFLIIRYVTPFYLIVLLFAWMHEYGIDIILMRGVEEVNRPYVLGARLMLTAIFVLLCVLIHFGFKKRKKRIFHIQKGKI